MGWRSFLLSILAFVLVTACSPSSFSESATTPSLADNCRVVEHAVGETEVCGQPQRVAALSPHILDCMLALGVQPVAYAESTELNVRRFDNPSEQIPHLGNFVTTQPANLGDRKSPSLELLAQLKPDLILGEDWTYGNYQLLSQIAPTLLFSDIKGEYQHWTNDIEGIAKALDRVEAAQELLIEIPRQIAATQAKLAPVAAMYPNILVISSNQLARSIEVAYNSTAAELLKASGFRIVVPEGVNPTSFNSTEISLEIMPDLEADIIFVMSWHEDFYHPQDALKQEWSENTLLRAIPAFQESRVFFVDYRLWGSNTRGPMTDRLILQKLPEMLLPLVR